MPGRSIITPPKAIRNRTRCQTLLGFILFLAAVQPIKPQPATVISHVEQWGIEEITLHSSRPHNNPFTDVSMKARFTTRDQSITVDGFYDGNQTWRVRLMPDIQGKWTFRTISNDPSLDGKSGSFFAGPPGKENHGPVKVFKTYHFSYADGTPYFLLGTTLYNWLNRDPDLERRTLATLSLSPFTKIRFGLFPKWLIYNHVDPKIYPYIKTGEKSFDLDRFDPRFFAHVELRLLELQKMGIEADIILFHPYDNWGFARMDAAHDEAYIRYVAARLSAFRNVWWTMCNEYNVFGFTWPPAMDQHLKPKDWDRLFQVLQSSDPYGHQTGMHNAGPWYDHSKPWITHVIAQESKRLGPLISDARARYAKPVVIDEFGYEGNVGAAWGDLTGREELNRLWEITMAGGYGSHGETYVHPHGLLWWAVGGDLVGESPSRLGFLKQVMTASPYQDLVPSPEVVMGGSALAKKGEYYLFRFAVSGTEPVQVDPEGAPLFKVELIDPWLMTTHSLGYTEAGPQAFITFAEPTILRLTKADAREPNLPKGTLTQLLAGFVGDAAPSEAPKLRPFVASAEHYSGDFALYQLMNDPRTRAILERYIPATLKTANKFTIFSVLPLSALVSSSPDAISLGQSFSSDSFQVSPEDFAIISHQLSEIPLK